MRTFISIFLVTAMTVAAAVAQPGHGDGRGPGGDKMKNRPGIDRLSDKLDLTPEQEKALQELRHELQGKMIDLRASAQKAKLEVQNQLSRDTVDRDMLMGAVEAEAAAELAIKKAMIDHQLKIRDIVGPEKAGQLRRLFHDRRGQGFGGDRGPGGPGGFGPGPEGDDDGGW